jgi:mannose-1-phosphate guanylyltransferase
VLEPDTFDRIPSDVAWSIERSYFPSLIERHETFVAYIYNGYWIDIGTPEKYLQVHRDILGGRFRVALEAEARGGGFVARGARIADGARLEAPFFVGPGCEIDAGAAIGPDAVLVADVRARAGSRVRDSVLWKGAEVGPEATIEGSLLGAGVRIGAHAVVRGAQLGEGSVVSDHSKSAGGAA